MRRFFRYALFTTIGSIILVGIVYTYLNRIKFAVPEAKFHSFSDFDFSSYSFGMVAVALAFASIYITTIAEPCCDRLIKLLQVHFTPAPFQDIVTMEQACNPTAVIPGLARTTGPQCAYAIILLRKWSALTVAERNDLLGPNGLSASRGWFGPVFSFFQSDYDRLIVAAFGISATLIYVAFPAIYLLEGGVLAVAMYIVIYILCVLEILICAVLYFMRWFFISGVEREMPRWVPEMRNLLVMAAMGRAQAANP